jgi:hypothetical protein
LEIPATIDRACRDHLLTVPLRRDHAGTRSVADDVLPIHGRSIHNAPTPIGRSLTIDDARPIDRPWRVNNTGAIDRGRIVGLLNRVFVDRVLSSNIGVIGGAVIAGAIGGTCIRVGRGIAIMVRIPIAVVGSGSRGAD